MKFHRIRPAKGTGSLLDPYNQRMVMEHDENGFVASEVQANHLIATELAVLIEANVEPPEHLGVGGTAPKAAAAPRAAKKKIDEELV